MSNLIFSLNNTLPVFLVMMLGYAMRRCGLISAGFAREMNTFVFKVALPVSLFNQLYKVDFASVWDTSYVLFCFIATLCSIAIAWVLSLLIKSKPERGEFIQVSYRSSASILGMAYIENMYGQAAMGTLMMIGCVPLYNVMAVLVLSLSSPDTEGVDKGQLKKALIGVLKNPILWGIIIGFVWALSGITLPAFAGTTIAYVGRLASPMGLLAMGAMLDMSAIRKVAAPVFGAVALKLLGFVSLFLPVAIGMGFTGEKLLAALIMLGSAATVSGYVMARNMGHKGDISAGAIALSTLLSGVSLTFWIWLLRTFAYI